MQYFIHLRTHSDYSLSEGLTKISDLIKYAVKFNMPALALTDYNNIFGIIKFYKLAQYYGIKPIIGVDLKYKEDVNKTFRLTALIMDEIGYSNIKKLLSLGYQDNTKNFYIKKEWLLEFNAGLIILSGGLLGDIADAITNQNFGQLKNRIYFWKQTFPNRYYLEISRLNQVLENYYINHVINFSIQEQIPIVATNNVYFLQSKDYSIHKIKLEINKLNVNVTNNKLYTNQQYFRTAKEMCNLFHDIPEAIINTVQIAKRCNLLIEIGKKFYLPNCKNINSSQEIYLKEEAGKGLKNKLLKICMNLNKEDRIKYTLKYSQRLCRELRIITKLGFTSYFLIVRELILWAKQQNIPVGPGRGSGAGSLVAYVLEITEIDPLKFNLFFERFLNPEKLTLPDIDIDLCMVRRDEMIEHIINLYGKDFVSQIITFGNLGAKGAIRDVGRILGYSYKFLDQITKMIPKDPKITISKALEQNLIFRELYQTDDSVRNLLDITKKIEGTIRNVGKHAGGIVISPLKIPDLTAIYYNEGYIIPITQFDKYDLADIGLVKFDFLGLTTLTIISYCLYLINKQNVKLNVPKININDIDFNDKKCFNYLLTLNTNAIFQLESFGIKSLIDKFKPDNFEDLIALLALYRPGPISSGMLDTFIARKQGKEPIFYPDKDFQDIRLESILKSTYGVIVYQEQVMEIAKTFAGYTLGEADLLISIMGNPDGMKKQRKLFVTKSMVYGHDQLVSQKMFDIIEKYAGYGFNKSHSTSYAVLTYQTLWLKTYFPAEFMAANLSSEMDNIERLIFLIEECKLFKIKILPPDINVSCYKFVINEQGNIIYGLGAIKGLGKNILNLLIEERNTNGNFQNFSDVCNRLIKKNINIYIIKILIFSGSLDRFNNRAQLLYELDMFWKLLNDYYNHGQCFLFNITNPTNSLKINHKNIFLPSNYILQKEYETLGTYLSKHPIQEQIYELKMYNNNNFFNHLSKFKFYKLLTIVGLIVDYKEKVNVKGKMYLLLTLEDHYTTIYVLVKKTTHKKFGDLFKKREICILSIQPLDMFMFNHHDKPLFLAHKIWSLTSAREQIAKYLEIRLIYKNINVSFISNLSTLLNKNRNGKLKLSINIIYNKDINIKLHTECKILPSNDFIDELSILLGSNHNIKIVF